MSLLAGLKTDNDVQEDDDRLGGGGGFQPLESDAYPMTVEMAYITKSKGGAMALNLRFSGEKKATLRTQLWITSGEAKGCKNTYEKKDKETGKVTKHYLPGFNQANAIALLTAGEEIGDLQTEVKTVNLYDFTAKKEVPTDVDMITAMVGEKIYVGVLKQLVNKRELNAATGNYEPVEETREENEIDKVFSIDDKRTVQEIRKELPEPIFFDQWVAGWQGKTKDKTVKTGVKAGAPKTGGAAPTKKLFGKK